MKFKRFRSKRYKGSPDIDIEYPGAGVFVTRGPNGSGKTSFLENQKSLKTTKEKAPKAVKTGESNSITIGEYEDAQGRIAEVTKHIDGATNKVKFELVYKDIKTTTLGDITSVFQFNDLTADKLIALGLTKPGRREQFNYVLQILPDDVREEFLKLQADESSYVDKRTIINREVKSAKATVDASKVTKEELELLKKKEQVENYIDKANKKIATIDKDKLELKTLIKAKDNFESVIDNITEQSEALDEKTLTEIAKVKKLVIEDYSGKIKAIVIPNIEKMTETLKKQKEGLKTIIGIETRNNSYKEEKRKYDEKFESQTDINEKITNVRAKIESFFTDKETPIPELIIGTLEKGLSIRTEDGVFPFVEDQLSTSQIMFITLKIMYFVNKNVDIIYLGKLESFGQGKRKALIEFAKEYDVQIMADEVNIDDNSNFIVELLIDDDTTKILTEIPLEKGKSINIPKKIEARKTKARDASDEQAEPITQKTKEEKQEEEDDFLNSAVF